MSEKQNAREHLEALLTGLEDEVMRGEGCVETDVAAMRAEIEALIEKHVGATGPAEAAVSQTGVAKGKVNSAVELLGRWARMGQDRVRGPLAARVRMAFSGTKPKQDDRGSGPKDVRDRGDRQGEKEN